jgi:putative ABC transport system substrate-binding protein
MIGRREFITLLGGAVAAWPIAARSQSRERMRRVGVLTNLTQTDSEGRARDEAFVQGLRQLGWTEGDNLRIDRRWTAGDAERGRQYAMDLVALAPDVILTTGSAGLIPLLQVTRSIPIVFTIVPDPVGAGFVDSLARPGGNATGFVQFEFGLSGKWLELLKEVAPVVTRVAVLREPGLTAAIAQFAALQAVAPSLRVDLVPLNFRDQADIERTVAGFVRSSNDGMIVTSGPLAAVRTGCSAWYLGSGPSCKDIRSRVVSCASNGIFQEEVRFDAGACSLPRGRDSLRLSGVLRQRAASLHGAAQLCQASSDPPAHRLRQIVQCKRF